MRRKILLSLLLLLACFTAGGLCASLYVTHTTAELHDLIELHQIENLRRSLVINLQSVQSDLYTLHTPLARKLDSIVANVLRMEAAAETCTECHHSAEVERQLTELDDMIGEYQDALSYYITTRANSERVETNQLEAAAIGHELLSRAQGMSHAATLHLEQLTLDATARIRRVRVILLLTVGLSLLLGLAIALRLARSVTAPVQQLLEATRSIAGGSLDQTLTFTDKTEFAELADNFNRMSTALRQSYLQLQTANEELEAEITERQRAEDRLRIDEFRLRSLLELYQMVDAKPQEVAEFVLHRATQLTGSRIGFVGFVTNDGRGFVQHAVSPAAMAQCGTLDRPDHFVIAEAGIWADAVRRKNPLVVNDYRNTKTPKKGYPAGHVEIRRLLSIPVLDRETVVGAAVVANKAEDYGETDIQQLTLLMHGMWQHVQRRKLDEELARAQKLESVGLLAGGIAHDFNNLLTGILGNVSLAERHLDPSGLPHGKLKEVAKACERAQRLTQQLLTFSKGGAPVREVADVGAIVRDAATFAASGASVKCVFQIPADLWVSAVDAGQIGQVVSNIVINAEQAMPDGGSIAIGCANVVVEPGEGVGPGPGEYVQISITDQGTGIDGALLDKVFDPYFTTKANGSGLGLATSYAIVRQHGGHLAVESEPGAGTTFRLYLPRADHREAPGDREETNSAPYESVAEGSGTRARVLVMDDEDAIRGLVLDILEMIGCEGVAVAEGAEALEQYQRAFATQAPFDLVILDLTIPGGMGGVETLRLLRELDPQVKAIVSSGYNDDPALAQFEHYGFSGRISKPYNLDRFRRGVEQVLGQGPSAHGTAPAAPPV